MNRDVFTAGAQRAIASARASAASEGCATGLRHLLQALLADESRAAATLRRFGVDAEQLTDRPVAEPATADSGEDELADLKAAFLSAVGGASASASPADDPPADDEPLRAVLGQARLQARLAGQADEVTSEHLLLGLLLVESPIARLLSESGLTRDYFEQTGAAIRRDIAPEPVSFAIDWQADAPDQRTATYRILDASANRAREGLRVVEDFVRFTLDDAHLSRLLKEARHQLCDLLAILQADRLMAARDTLADVGTTIHTASEMTRATPLAVARASLKRVQEAARTLEEFSKLLPAGTTASGAAVVFPERFGALRYSLYTLEKAVLQTVHSGRELAGRSLYLLLTTALCRLDPLTVVREAAAGGVGIVQIREKQMPDRELLAHARRMCELTRALGLLLIVNDRPDLAVLCEADGVHVGQDELSVRDVRRIVGPDLLIGVSTHSLDQARQAVLDGASYLGVGPVFESRTKRFDEFVGLELVQAVAAEIALPWFPIGGIDPQNVHAVRQAGARRAAVSSAICGADDPRRQAAALVQALNSE